MSHVQIINTQKVRKIFLRFFFFFYQLNLDIYVLTLVIKVNAVLLLNLLTVKRPDLNYVRTMCES